MPLLTPKRIRVLPAIVLGLVSQPGVAAGNDPAVALTTSMKGWTSSSCFKPWSMDFSFPFIIKYFIHNNHKPCSVKMLIPAVSEYSVRSVASPDLKYLLVSVAIPKFFPEYSRIEASNLRDKKFHQNTSIALAHCKCVQSIRAAFNGQSDISGKPTKIKLPYKVDESIVHWDIRLLAGGEVVTEVTGP